MRKFMFIFVLIIALAIPGSTSYLSDLETTDARFASAECFQDCGEEEERGPQLLFFSNDEQTEVGFLLTGVKEYDKATYQITYRHDPGIKEGITGMIDNSDGEDEILEEGIVLGTCSADVCTYHEGIEEVKLIIKLGKNGSVEETLEEALIF